MNVDELGARIIIGFGDGEVFINECVLGGMIIAVILAVFFIWLGSGLKERPKGKQVLAEFIVEKIYNLVQANMGSTWFAPYIGTLFAYILLGSMLGLIGIRPITSDLNVTCGLSLLTFIIIQFYAIKTHGIKGRIKELCSPYVFMFPMKLVEECTLPVSLGFRLFGNIFGGMVIVDLFLSLMTKLSSYLTEIPFFRFLTVLPLNAFFDIFEPVIQTFIFGTLTMVFLANAMPKKA